MLTYKPIQYHTPLYQRLADRGNVQIDVLFLTDEGHRPLNDPGFDTTIIWDLDLLSGYSSRFLSSVEHKANHAKRISRLAQWLPTHDVVVIHGYADPWMILAMTICRLHRIPYLLRGASQPQPQATGVRRHLRNAVARTAVSTSACGLPVGQLSTDFFRRYGARRIVLAPNSIDDERFARTPSIGRSELLAGLGLDSTKPVIMFSGKLIPRKRPLDLVAAVSLLPQSVITLFVGAGSLAEDVRAALAPGHGAVTGFINQSELPAYYHACDILVLPSEVEVWGLVVNEAMAAGALPIVSDRVGAGPDLVQGIGEIYPCGDIQSLADSLSRALTQIKTPGIRTKMQDYAARCSLNRTAEGYEEAVLAVCATQNVLGLQRGPGMSV